MKMRVVLVVTGIATVLAGSAGAECCLVVKTDAATSSTNVRVCAPGPAQSCAVELFAGTLALGQGQDVCIEDYPPAGDTVISCFP